MKKFIANSSQFCVILYGEKTTDNYYTSIRLQVKGVVTKTSNLSGWVGDMYYGYTCYLPEKPSARKFLKEYVNGKQFKAKYKRRINAIHRFDTISRKQEIFDKMMEKLNHLIDNSFNA